MAVVIDKEVTEVIEPKKEFVANMAEELGCTKTDAEASLALVLDMISDVSLVLLVLFFRLGLERDFDGYGRTSCYSSEIATSNALHNTILQYN